MTCVKLWWNTLYHTSDAEHLSLLIVKCCSTAFVTGCLMAFLQLVSCSVLFNLLIASQLKKELAWANQMKAVKAGVI